MSSSLRRTSHESRGREEILGFNPPSVTSLSSFFFLNGSKFLLPREVGGSCLRESSECSEAVSLRARHKLSGSSLILLIALVAMHPLCVSPGRELRRQSHSGSEERGQVWGNGSQEVAVLVLMLRQQQTRQG